MSAQKSFLHFRLKDGSEGVNVANFGCAAMHMHSRSAKIIPCCFISFLLQRKPSSSRGEKTGILAWEQIPLTYTLHICPTHCGIETSNGGSWAGKRILARRRTSSKPSSICLSYVVYAENQIVEYIVDHRCTEWELERALIQYLKSTIVVSFSLTAQLREEDRGAIAAIVDQFVSSWRVLFEQTETLWCGIL